MRSLNLCIYRKRVSEFMNSILQSDENENMNDCPIFHTSEEALALIEEADLSKTQYHMIHTQAKKRNADIYPAYDNLVKSKEECYPHSIKVTEKGFTIRLKSLLDHTIPLRLHLEDSVNSVV